MEGKTIIGIKHSQNETANALNTVKWTFLILSDTPLFHTRMGLNRVCSNTFMRYMYNHEKLT